MEGDINMPKDRVQVKKMGPRWSSTEWNFYKKCHSKVSILYPFGCEDVRFLYLSPKQKLSKNATLKMEFLV